jgi:2-dehydro-3-deoxy-D-pentonate aldolase
VRGDRARFAQIGWDEMKISGIYTPLVTPLAGQDALDERALAGLIEHVIGGGVHGIFVLGTTGEGPLLSQKLRLSVISRAAAAIAGRVPLLVGVTGSSFTENLELACASASAGAKAVVYAGPLYAPLAQDALAAHVERFATQCPLPVFLYNMPSHTNLFFEPATVLRLSGVRGIAGLKDSSGNLMYLQKVARAVGPDFPVFVGPEEMLYPALLGGAVGGVNGGSNLWPELFVALYEATVRGDHEEAIRLQRVSIELSEAVYSGGYLAGLKAAMAARGLCGATMAEPGVALNAEAAARIAEALARPEFAAGAAAITR